MREEDRRVVGTHPPRGYVDWHLWAGIQHRAGLRQTRTACCELWLYPQEKCKCER